MNKLTVVIFVSLFLIYPFLSAYAHSGGLDQQGGHHNRKTGEYHYHQGPYKRVPVSYQSQKTKDENNYFPVVIALGIACIALGYYWGNKKEKGET